MVLWAWLGVGYGTGVAVRPSGKMGGCREAVSFPYRGELEDDSLDSELSLERLDSLESELSLERLESLNRLALDSEDALSEESEEAEGLGDGGSGRPTRATPKKGGSGGAERRGGLLH